MIRAWALQGHRTQQLMLGNGFPTFFFSDLETDSHDHRTLASQSPGVLLSPLICSPFLSPLLWILACHQELCNTSPLPLAVVPLLCLLWDKEPNILVQPAPHERSSSLRQKMF